MTHALEELDIGVDRGRLHIERSPRWVRALVDGQPIADSKQVLLVFEPRRLPVYYFPIADVRMDVLKPSDYSQSAGDASRMTRWNLELAGRRIDNVGWSHREPDAEHAPLKDHVAFYWGKLDAWFEEDEEVWVHPRDPYKRVDAIASSRDVRVLVDTAWRWRTPGGRRCCSRPDFRRATTCRGPTCTGAARANRHDDAVSVQGPRAVLVDSHRRHAAQGSCVELSVSDRGVPQDREADGVLQRESRHLHRRPAPGTSEDDVVLERRLLTGRRSGRARR